MHMHPWYRLPTLKRKSSFEYDSDLALHGQKSLISALTTPMDREPAPSPKSKRRRCDNLEHGFSQMSLNPSVALQHNPNSAPVVSLPPATFIPAQQAQPPFAGFSNAPYNNTFVPLAPASMPADVNPTPTPTSLSVVNGSGAQYPANDLSADISPAPVDNVDFSWYEPEKDRKYRSPVVYILVSEWNVHFRHNRNRPRTLHSLHRISSIQLSHTPTFDPNIRRGRKP